MLDLPLLGKKEACFSLFAVAVLAGSILLLLTLVCKPKSGRTVYAAGAEQPYGNLLTPSQ